MIIKPLEPRDIDLVINLFGYYSDEAGIDPEQYDENRVLNTIKQYAIRPNLFFRVCWLGQRPIGCIGGFLSEDPVERETTATIQFLYLLPDHADIMNYRQMIQEFTNWAEQFSATNIRAIDIGHNPNRLQEVYERLEFRPVRVSIMNKEIQ